MPTVWGYVDSGLCPQWPSKNLLWKNQQSSGCNSVLHPPGLCALVTMRLSLLAFSIPPLNTEFLATSASALNGSWWRWITNLSSAGAAPKKTIRPGTCSIRYTTWWGEEPPQTLLVISGPFYLEEEGLEPSEGKGGFGERIESHTPRSSRSRWHLEPFRTLVSWSHWCHWEVGAMEGEERWQW